MKLTFLMPIGFPIADETDYSWKKYSNECNKRLTTEFQLHGIVQATGIQWSSIENGSFLATVSFDSINYLPLHQVCNFNYKHGLPVFCVRQEFGGVYVEIMGRLVFIFPKTEVSCRMEGPCESFPFYGTIFSVRNYGNYVTMESCCITGLSIPMLTISLSASRGESIL